MARTIGIGAQDFEYLRRNDYFYMDKTDFIREWWENGDCVTLITRPRRFGKTLNMNMLERFFSLEYAGKGDIFEGLNIWQEQKYRELQGTYPVIFLSFANVKEKNYELTRKKIISFIKMAYEKNRFLIESGKLSDADIDYYNRVSEQMDDSDASLLIYKMCDYLYRYYGKKAIVLGLMVELQGRYIITSNRESGFGRYDVMLEPQKDGDPVFIIEFKVRNSRREKDMEETLAAALQQIDEKDYARTLVDKGFAPERIYRYGFAFEGKRVLIG